MLDILKRVEVKEDGVYFLINYSTDNPKDDIEYVANYFNISNINHIEIDKAIRENSKYAFLTYDKQAVCPDETFKIKIIDDMLAEINFFPPKQDGKLIVKDEIIEAGEKLNIKFGIDEKQIEEFLETRNYRKTYIFAKGKEPIYSKDGYIDYKVEINKKKPKPKELEDGSIDHKTLDLIEMVKDGDLLSIKVDAVQGEDGMDILGRVLKINPAKEAPDMVQGKNTFLSEDGKTLRATSDGYIFVQKKTIHVLPVLEIDGSVDNSTGNIDFVGNVIITGNVLTDFVVKAEGSVEIWGSVEGATIIAEGDICVKSGVQGVGKAKLISKKNIILNFVENATLEAKKDIMASAIMHCDVLCKGDVTIMGRKGLIVGGKSIINGNLLAKNIGSSMSSNTSITVGLDYEVVQKYDYLLEKLKIANDKYEEVKKIVDKLKKVDIETLSQEKRALFEKSIKEKLKLKKKIVSYKSDIRILIPLFTRKKSKIQVLENIYSGTKIGMNSSIMFIKEDLGACEIINEDGKIKIFK